jgi:hypothetical protein
LFEKRCKAAAGILADTGDKWSLLADRLVFEAIRDIQVEFKAEKHYVYDLVYMRFWGARRSINRKKGKRGTPDDDSKRKGKRSRMDDDGGFASDIDSGRRASKGKRDNTDRESEGSGRKKAKMESPSSGSDDDLPIVIRTHKRKSEDVTPIVAEGKPPQADPQVQKLVQKLFYKLEKKDDVEEKEPLPHRNWLGLEKKQKVVHSAAMPPPPPVFPNGFDPDLQALIEKTNKPVNLFKGRPPAEPQVQIARGLNGGWGRDTAQMLGLDQPEQWVIVRNITANKKHYLDALTTPTMRKDHKSWNAVSMEGHPISNVADLLATERADGGVLVYIGIIAEMFALLGEEPDA